MKKILAIDDSKLNLSVLETIINDVFPDSVIFTATDGPGGIALAIAEDPDVILLDVVMPGMDGFEVCTLLKKDERVSDIPVVFLTAIERSRESRVKALEMGAEGFLAKPIDEIELTAQIKAMVKIKAADRQKRDEQERLSSLVAERTSKLEQSQTETLKLLDDLLVEINIRKKVEIDLIAAKEKAEESDRLKTAFLQNISHEIRTPMNAIVGFSDFLNDPDLEVEERKHLTEIIIQSSKQLLYIITDIVSIATIEAGQEKISEKEINLNSICKIVEEHYAPKALNQNVSLSYKVMLDDEESNIITDEIKLQQILSNLVGNALKFTMQGHVEFGYKVKDDQLEFYVEDTGIGVPPEMHTEIFKRFRQVEITASRQFGGSGLGLSISKAYVEILGGKIWLNSEPGKGSMFLFIIPYKKVLKKEIAEKSPVDALTFGFHKSKTILIAEDEDLNFQLLLVLLSRMGLTVIRAANGVEAVEICRSEQAIDLVLMDIKMPVMNGYEATKIIKELRPQLPVIAQTAYSTDYDRAKAFACGCSDFISKPFKRDQLITIISEQLINHN